MHGDAYRRLISGFCGSFLFFVHDLNVNVFPLYYHKDLKIVPEASKNTKMDSSKIYDIVGGETDVEGYNEDDALAEKNPLPKSRAESSCTQQPTINLDNVNCPSG